MNCLLHVCCGPCAIMCVEALRREGIAVTGYFANPNIHPVTEYLKRREAMRLVAERLELPMIWEDEAYHVPGWLGMVHQLGIADNQEHLRCRYCYESRLALTCDAAIRKQFDCFSTTLLYSLYQQHEIIAELGESLTIPGEMLFLYRDFRPYWHEGIARSKEWEIFRQNYCGCIFSEYTRFEGKIRKLKNT